MKYIILFLSFIFCSDLSDLVKSDNQSPSNSNVVHTVSIDKKSPIIYAMYSAIIPGAGEYALHKKYSKKIAKKRALIFFGIEIAAWISTFSFKEKYYSQVSKYQDYADSEIAWDFERWIQEYDTFMINYEDVWSSGIGEGSHSVEFYYNGDLTSTTSHDFNILQD